MGIQKLKMFLLLYIQLKTEIPSKQLKKIGCTAANYRLLRGKPLCYGTIGLLNQNIYLRSKINVTLPKGNTVVALRKKPDAMTLLQNVDRFHSC